MTIFFAIVAAFLALVVWILCRECREMNDEVENLDDIACYWEAQAKRLAALNDTTTVFTPPHSAWSYDRSMQGIA